MVWTLCSVVFVPNIKNVKVCETLTDSLWFKFMAVLSPLERMFNGEPSWLELLFKLVAFVAVPARGRYAYRRMALMNCKRLPTKQVGPSAYFNTRKS